MKSLVTGANGHLGNNLVRQLIKDGQEVKAGIRNLDNSNTLSNLDCEILHCDFLDLDSLRKSFKNVEVLYHVAAVFKHWAIDEEKEIVSPNVEGTINVFKIAKEAGIKKIIYVSTMASLEHTRRNEKGEIKNDSWNTSNQDNPYARSKTLAEQKAWELAADFGLDLITVLPSTIIGGEFKKSTETINLMSAIINNKVPFAYETYLNLVDATDVSDAMIQASKTGIIGSRYILSNTSYLSINEILNIAKKTNPNLGEFEIKSFDEMIFISNKLEEDSKKNGSRPAFITSNIKRTCGIRYSFDISNTISDLTYSPKPCDEILDETFRSLYMQ